MGALSIEVLDDVHSTSNCGGMDFRVRWHVDGQANGAIIQHIITKDNVRKCDGSPIDVSDDEFYEAWQVRNGVVYIGVSDDIHEFDSFVRGPAGDNTKGFHFLKGTVEFIEGYEILIDPFGPWKQNDIAAAHELPTTRVKPKEFDEATALIHASEDRWNCCGGPGAFRTAVGRVLPAEFRYERKEEPPKKAGDSGKPKGEGEWRMLRELRAMPPWSDLKARDKKGRQTVERTLKRLSAASTKSLRRVLAAYMNELNKCSGIAEMSRLFVANRYLFAVPARLPLDSPILSGWRGIPQTEDSIDPLWPWSESRKGDLTLTGVYAGYQGDQFRALREFDYFLERFGRRR